MTSVFEDFLKISDKYIRREDVKTFWDVGAGNCAETLSAIEAYPNAKAYAFEANPACILDCAKTIVNNNRIALVPICISEVNKIVEFHPINQTRTITTHADGNPRASSLFLANGTYPIETYVQDTLIIPTMRLRTIQHLLHIPQPDIMWMDLQGAELSAFKGMDFDFNFPTIIHTEGWGKEIYTGQSNFIQMDEYLISVGYKCINPPLNDDWIWADFDYIKSDKL